MQRSTKNDQDKQKSILKSQQGQTFVEFVLLITVIMMLSFFFLKLVNTGVAKYWLAMGQLLTEDTTQSLQLR